MNLKWFLIISKIVVACSSFIFLWRCKPSLIVASSALPFYVSLAIQHIGQLKQTCMLFLVSPQHPEMPLLLLLTTPVRILRTSGYQLQNACESLPLMRKKSEDQEKYLEFIESINPSDISVYFCNIIWGLFWDKISGWTSYSWVTL